VNISTTTPWEVAGRLVRVTGRQPETHTVLQENVATLLTQLKPDFVDQLQALSDEKLMDGLNGSYANGPVHMALKLSRDIRQKPYSDEQVMQRLEHLDREFKTASAAVIEGSPGFPCKFYVCGSLLKGRFGAESDLDVLCQASPNWVRAQPWDAAQRDVSFQYIDMPKAEDREKFVQAFAPVLEVSASDIQQPGFVASLYAQSLERKGYRLEDGHLQAQSPTIVREVETPPEAARHIMWSLPMV
jgi:hypothetical protein